jgi:hypothetical protein
VLAFLDRMACVPGLTWSVESEISGCISLEPNNQPRLEGVVSDVLAWFDLKAPAWGRLCLHFLEPKPKQSGRAWLALAFTSV